MGSRPWTIGHLRPWVLPQMLIPGPIPDWDQNGRTRVSFKCVFSAKQLHAKETRKWRSSVRDAHRHSPASDLLVSAKARAVGLNSLITKKKKKKNHALITGPSQQGVHHIPRLPARELPPAWNQGQSRSAQPPSHAGESFLLIPHPNGQHESKRTADITSSIRTTVRVTGGRMSICPGPGIQKSLRRTSPGRSVAGSPLPLPRPSYAMGNRTCD